VTGYRSLIAAIAAVIMLVLTSCSSTSDSASSSSKLSLEALTQQSLSTLAGVTSVDAHQMAVTKASSNRSDPDAWSLDIDVAMADGATADQVVAAANATRAFTKDHVGSARWVAHLRVGAITTVPGEDRAASSPLQIEIYPTVRSSAGADARDAIALKVIPRVTGVAITNKVVFVQVTDAKDLTPVFDKLRALPIWKAGGTLKTDTDQIRLADVPARITAAQVHAFFSASVVYPDADFAIESSGQSPEVYVNHVTTAQARAITSSFTKPALAAKTLDGFVLEFNIRASDANQTLDTHGTFGERASS